jgi:ketosteroid isomerase-like protein
VPPDHIEVVLDQFAATNERDFARAMALYADEVILVARGGLNPGMFEGKDAVGGWFGDWIGTFEPGYRFEIEETRDLGNGAVYLLASHGGRGKASGAEVRGETAYLYRVRDGKIVRVELFFTPEDALEVASSPEWSKTETD